MTTKPKPIGRAMAFYIGVAALACGSAIAIAQSAAPDKSQSAAWHNQQQIALSGLKAEDGWRYEEGGLMWRRVAGDGRGEKPALSDRVTVHYAGTLVDGTEFDSSYKRGEPATFPLGGLIPAWKMAIPKMAVGDKIELAAPASLAYGPRGKGPIPGGATLLFTVELLDIVE